LRRLLIELVLWCSVYGPRQLRRRVLRVKGHSARYL
jgi:hypothetical protein